MHGPACILDHPVPTKEARMPPSDVTACLRRQRQPARAPRTLEASRAPHIPPPFSRTHRPLPPPLRPAELLGREIGSSRARSARAAAGRPRGARRWGQSAPSAAGVFCPSAPAPRRLAPRGGCGCGAGGGYGPHRWRGGGSPWRGTHLLAGQAAAHLWRRLRGQFWKPWLPLLQFSSRVAQSPGEPLDSRPILKTMGAPEPRPRCALATTALRRASPLI